MTTLCGGCHLNWADASLSRREHRLRMLQESIVESIESIQIEALLCSWSNVKNKTSKQNAALSFGCFHTETHAHLRAGFTSSSWSVLLSRQTVKLGWLERIQPWTKLRHLHFTENQRVPPPSRPIFPLTIHKIKLQFRVGWGHFHTLLFGVLHDLPGSQRVQGLSSLWTTLFCKLLLRLCLPHHFLLTEHDYNKANTNTVWITMKAPR